ncbi:MAG TPA: hypothetical protein VLC10_00580 [Patescibacteria group bacterium]|nr:hypothetical protein [Patescibacteria group bacterium]
MLIEGFSGPKKPERKSAPRANERDIANFLGVKKLLELGYLPPEQAADMDAIRRAKAAATETVKNMKPTKEELGSVEFSEKIKRA